MTSFIIHFIYSYGGIIPPRAQDLHRLKIANTFERCLEESGLACEEIDAIAVTTRPGEKKLWLH